MVISCQVLTKNMKYNLYSQAFCRRRINACKGGTFNAQNLCLLIYISANLLWTAGLLGLQVFIDKLNENSKMLRYIRFSIMSKI